jgi:hypothetical protein
VFQKYYWKKPKKISNKVFLISNNGSVGGGGIMMGYDATVECFVAVF